MSAMDNFLQGLLQQQQQKQRSSSTMISSILLVEDPARLPSNTLLERHAGRVNTQENHNRRGNKASSCRWGSWMVVDDQGQDHIMHQAQAPPQLPLHQLSPTPTLALASEAPWKTPTRDDDLPPIRPQRRGSLLSKTYPSSPLDGISNNNNTSNTLSPSHLMALLDELDLEDDDDSEASDEEEKSVSDGSHDALYSSGQDQAPPSDMRLAVMNPAA